MNPKAGGEVEQRGHERTAAINDRVAELQTQNPCVRQRHLVFLEFGPACITIDRVAERDIEANAEWFVTDNNGGLRGNEASGIRWPRDD